MTVLRCLACLLLFGLLGCHRQVHVAPAPKPIDDPSWKACFHFLDERQSFCTNDAGEIAFWNNEWKVEKSHWIWRGETW